MPRHSPTGNAHKRCKCGRARQSSCAHPWFVAYKAPRSHPLRAGQRFRLNLDTLIGFHPSNLTEAKTEARRAIEAWLNGRDPAALQPSDLPTLAQVLDAYHQRPEAPGREVGQFGPITRAIINGRRFGDWRTVEITREAIEAYRRQRPRVAANRDLALLRAMFNWAVLAELVPATPFKVGTVAAIKLSREEPRTRRLEPGEEERLLTAARGLLPHLVVAGLETGCRLGELLSLQWDQVRGDLFLPAGKTKAKKPRRVPISSVLRAVLDARRFDPSGEPLPPFAYVFGDELGRRRRSIRGAWVALCKRAHLIDLNFHDLRREAGSRGGGARAARAQQPRGGWGNKTPPGPRSFWVPFGGGGEEGGAPPAPHRPRPAWGKGGFSPPATAPAPPPATQHETKTPIKTWSCINRQG